jgi:hypothetical protein
VTGPLGFGTLAGHFLGPLGGFGVAVVVHAVGSVAAEVAQGKKSPYRFLTMAEKAGVVWSIGGEAASIA